MAARVGNPRTSQRDPDGEVLLRLPRQYPPDRHSHRTTPSILSPLRLRFGFTFPAKSICTTTFETVCTGVGAP
jgi:hypothetical protein